MGSDEFRRLNEREMLVEIHRMLRVLVTGEIAIMSTQAQIDAAIAQLSAEVAKETTVEQGAITLINGIPKLIADAVAAVQAANPGLDVSALTAVSATIASNATQLAASVAANTPTAPPVPAT